MKNGTKIVSSIYELNYINELGGGVYKGFSLLTSTLRNIIFPEYKYVIYTDQNSYKKFNLRDEFNYPNVEFKFKELNTSSFCGLINRVRQDELSKGVNYDRIYSVNGYLEVILSKLEFIMNESVDCENVIWVDAGLIGTSCHDRWRDYMVPLVNSKNFLDKINGKINSYGFVHLIGNSILVSQELKNRFELLFGTELKVVPGCLFGGKSNIVHDTLNGYLDIFIKYVEKYNHLISEQELLSVMTSRNCDEYHSYKFEDWLDLQKSLLQILDVYDASKYTREKCYV